jgi:hypothetical protein
MIRLWNVGEKDFSERHELVLSIGIGGSESVVLRPDLSETAKPFRIRKCKRYLLTLTFIMIN